MNKLKDLLQEVYRLAKLYPNLEDQMLEYFDLATMEIEDGGSKEHEISLALNSINQLIKENQNV